jgi:hypothetical protein
MDMRTFFAEIFGRDRFAAGIAMANEQEIPKVLNRYGVQFIVIGGYAVNFHGFTRVTEDMDVVWIRSKQADEALFAALNEIDARYIGEEIDPSTGIERTYPVTLPYIQSLGLMMLWTKFGFLDLFDYIPGFPQEDVRQLMTSSVEAAGTRYASLHWLRQMKGAAARTKDQLDLENLPE